MKRIGSKRETTTRALQKVSTLTLYTQKTVTVSGVRYPLMGHCIDPVDNEPYPYNNTKVVKREF